jgi:hypothetical protein
MTALSYGPLAIKLEIATPLGTCVVPSTNFRILRTPRRNISQAGGTVAGELGVVFSSCDESITSPFMQRKLCKTEAGS